MKYFLFNKASDYERGYAEHASWDGRGLAVEPGYMGKAVFFSRVLDSGEDGTRWHRLTCAFPGGSGAAMRISFYTSDGAVWEQEGETVELRKLIRSPERTPAEKKAAMSRFLRRQAPFAPDLLLHGLEGRYLWFLLELYPQGGDFPALRDFTIYFPAESWVSGLPELYRGSGEDSFLDRYLSIFQSLQDDLTRQIRSFPLCLDPETAPPDFLSWLAGWLDIEEPYMWEEKKLRRLLGRAVELYGARGTRRGLESFVELYTGEKPFIVEWQDWEDFRGNGERGRLLEKLYEADPGCLTVMVRESCIPAPGGVQALYRLLESLKPVQLRVRLIVLKPYLFADWYSYLGVNSVLGRYDEAVLGVTGRLAFATVGERGDGVDQDKIFSDELAFATAEERGDGEEGDRI